jgi:rhamnosyltransferase
VYIHNPRVWRVLTHICRSSLDMNRAAEQIFLANGDTTAHPVCAVIVTYHPSTSMIANLATISAQVQGMVIVDNASPSDAVTALRNASSNLGFHLIENCENLGIAEALNQGVRWAKQKEYFWVVLFDQDSRIEGEFLQQLLATWESHPQKDRVASVQPRYVNPRSGLGPMVRRARDGGPVYSMTSGALLPTWIFDQVGWFASEYFIDWVDIEYCFRIRAAGYLIAESQDAVLLHAPGHSLPHSLFGFTFRPTHHSAMRRYYMSRNRIAVFRRYLLTFPAWILQSMYESARETIKCFLAENDRPRKLRAFLLGTWDGLTGRMGRREGL